MDGGNLGVVNKIVKRSLKAITLDRIFTEETLYTLLYEVESLLNNRAVTPSCNYINDYEALTPNHLILGNTSSNHSPWKCQNYEITTAKNGVRYRQQLLCFSISDVKNACKHLFNDGNGTENQKI